MTCQPLPGPVRWTVRLCDRNKQEALACAWGSVKKQCFLIPLLLFPTPPVSGRFGTRKERHRLALQGPPPPAPAHRNAMILTSTVHFLPGRLRWERLEENPALKAPRCHAAPPQQTLTKQCVGPQAKIQTQTPSAGRPCVPPPISSYLHRRNVTISNSEALSHLSNHA